MFNHRSSAASEQLVLPAKWSLRDLPRVTLEQRHAAAIHSEVLSLLEAGRTPTATNFYLLLTAGAARVPQRPYAVMSQKSAGRLNELKSELYTEWRDAMLKSPKVDPVSKMLLGFDSRELASDRTLADVLMSGSSLGSSCPLEYQDPYARPNPGLLHVTPRLRTPGATLEGPDPSRRLYVNCHPDLIPTVLERLIALTDRHKVEARFKIVDWTVEELMPLSTMRREQLVAYIFPGAARSVIAELKDIAEQFPKGFKGREAPWFTIPVAPGVAYSADFTEHQLRIFGANTPSFMRVRSTMVHDTLMRVVREGVRIYGLSKRLGEVLSEGDYPWTRADSFLRAFDSAVSPIPKKFHAPLGEMMRDVLPEMSANQLHADMSRHLTTVCEQLGIDRRNLAFNTPSSRM